MDWNEVEEHLYSVKNAYESIGFAGSFALGLTINPLVKRFEQGERTEKLHDEIMALE